MKVVRRCLVMLAGLLAVGCAPGVSEPGVSSDHGATPAEGTPFFNARSHTAEYAGPGRDDPPPGEPGEVRIGWFGPDTSEHPLAGQMWQAAALALEQANASGGYRGQPFRLLATWSENPWGSGVKGLTRLVYDQQVWALVGAPDGPSAHLAAQVVAKARLTFISPVSTDKTTNLANVPWVFSCAPGDHLLAPVLADAVASQAGQDGFVVVSCTDHDSRLFAAELFRAVGQLGLSPRMHFEYTPETTDLDEQVARIGQVAPDTIVLIAGPSEAARMLVDLRAAGVSAAILGGPAMGRAPFLEAAGVAAEDVLFPLFWSPPEEHDPSADFASRFRERYGRSPDYTAAQTYDAVNLLVAAIRESGLNRARIRDAVRSLSPWSGVAGRINWDPTGHNRRVVRLGTVHNGEVVPAP